MPPSRESFYNRQTHHSSRSQGSTDRGRHRAYLDLERLRRRWALTEAELDACQRASQHVGDEGPSALAELSRLLYGDDYDEISTERKQRLDKLAYVLQRMAQR